jgi:hypothetical protein
MPPKSRLKTDLGMVLPTPQPEVETKRRNVTGGLSGTARRGVTNTERDFKTRTRPWKLSNHVAYGRAILL